MALSEDDKGKKAVFFEAWSQLGLKARSLNPLRRMKRMLIRAGICAVCGTPDAVDSSFAMDLPLVSAASRMLFLQMLSSAGVSHFRSTSGLGHDFLCHTGDIAAFPFYLRRAYETELRLCTGWLRGSDRPIIYDIGANTGFFCGQLAQMIAPRQPKIYAFEPVPTTFAKLSLSIELLSLNDRIVPINAAVIDKPGKISLTYSDRNSLLSQVTKQNHNPRVGSTVAEATALTLDDFVGSSNSFPDLVKIDVEGSEVAAFRGASALLARADRPAILFEYNPQTLSECGASTAEILEFLSGYSLYYVDDLKGGMLPFAAPVHHLDRLDWICNLFAVPDEDAPKRRWQTFLASSR